MLTLGKDTNASTLLKTLVDGAVHVVLVNVGQDLVRKPPSLGDLGLLSDFGRPRDGSVLVLAVDGELSFEPVEYPAHR